MKTVGIYLAGGMGALSLEEQTRWRKQVRDAIIYGDYDCEYKPLFFDPTQYYNFEKPLKHKSEGESMEFDLYNLKRSDLVVVNFNDPKSIGTAMELMIAKENGIPIIGLNEDGAELHPWLIECVNRMCDDMRELVNHVVDFYLN